MPSPTPSSNRLAWLDVARGFAVLLVLFDHGIRAALPELDAIITQYMGLGNFGVTLFFFCSGFIIPVSAESSSLQAFWIRRFFRLYPLYWLSILTALIVGYAEVSTPVEIAANLTMLQQLMGIAHMNGIYWSLSIEMLFYILVSGFVFTRTISYTIPITVGLISTAIIVEGIIGRPTWIFSFLATIYLGTIFYRWNSGVVSSRTAIGLYVAGICMIIVTRLGIRFDRMEYFSWMMSCLAGYVLFLLLFFRRFTLEMRPIAYIGIISYSIYLLHPAVIRMIDLGNSIINLVVWLFVSIIVGSATYYVIEKPCMQLSRRWTRNNTRPSIGVHSSVSTLQRSSSD